jgi:hypothetical protein
MLSTATLKGPVAFTELRHPHWCNRWIPLIQRPQRAGRNYASMHHHLRDHGVLRDPHLMDPLTHAFFCATRTAERETEHLQCGCRTRGLHGAACFAGNYFLIGHSTHDTDLTNRPDTLRNLTGTTLHPTPMLTSLQAWIGAPPSISTLAVSCWPLAAARCSGVQLSCNSVTQTATKHLKFGNSTKDGSRDREQAFTP